ncbi:MAG: hypothetical protein AAGF13_10550 [Pseudomonadota bacterium]
MTKHAARAPVFSLFTRLTGGTRKEVTRGPTHIRSRAIGSRYPRDIVRFSLRVALTFIAFSFTAACPSGNDLRLPGAASDTPIGASTISVGGSVKVSLFGDSIE